MTPASGPTGRRWARSAFAVALVMGATGIGGAATARAAVDDAWTVTELQPLTAGALTLVHDINDDGISVGSSGTSAVEWDENGTPTALPNPVGCTNGQAQHISDDGDVVGMADCGNGTTKGTYWHNGVVSTPAPTMWLYGVNDAGAAVGVDLPQGAGPGKPDHPGLVLPGHPAQDLIDGGADGGNAAAITNTYLAVGTVTYNQPTADNNLQTTHAVGWYGPYVFPLISSPHNTRAVTANDAGYSLVTIDDPAQPYSVIVAPHTGQVIPLSSSHEDGGSDLNDDGIVVGTKTHYYGGFLNVGFTGELYVYGTAVDLDSLVSDDDFGRFLDYQSPRALNNDLWIVGNTSLEDNQAWLMRPPSG
jgi:hypothetical protein